MISIGTISVLVLSLGTVIAQYRQCSVSYWSGRCVAFKECIQTNRQGEFLNPEEIVEIRKRIYACSNYGRGLACCEENQISSVTLPPPTTATYTTTTQQVVVNPNVGSYSDDPLLHYNYRLFKDLKCGGSSLNRVAFGTDATLFEFPWAARLGYDRLGEIEYNCAGSVISEFYVLTAAHCLVSQASDLILATVRLGEYDTSTIQDCDNSDPEDPDCSEPVQDIRVKSFVAHPNFDKEKVLHDLGLIQLETAANFGQRNIKPICLPFTRDLQKLPNQLIVVGWGRTEKASRSSILQKATLPLYDLNQCYNTFTQLSRKPIVFSEGQFCAGGEGKIDACRGDSGSSIQAVGTVNGRPKMVLQGVVSYGISLCGVKEGIPGVYTRVSKYLIWILSNMQ